MSHSGAPLQGITVLELGHIVAGPTAGQILAELGAEVIKIESVGGGDQARNMPGSIAAMFHFLNRNKQSVALDLKGEGREVFLRMAASADVVVDNFAYQAVDRLGIGYPVVSELNPGLVWLSIKGFLPGPSEALPMLDELAQMAGGLAFMTGLPGKPMRAGASLTDNAAAAYGVIGVLAALFSRNANGGRGRHVTTGLYETCAYFVAQWMGAAQYSGEPSVPISVVRQDTRMGFSVYRLFDTADGSQVFIGIVSDAHWDRFCAEFGLAALHDDPRFADEASRRLNRPALYEALAGLVGGFTKQEAAARLRAAKIPFAPVNRPDELGADEHLAQSGQLVDVPLPNGVVGKAPKLPFRLGGHDMAVRNLAPALGADTRAVLARYGFSADEIAALEEKGVIRAAAA
ncbi:CaiB/BaiF CoA-transferase family protein [Pigmentiphaga soli]|uniref:CaiB/BaiF CoA-transferase family protein n=1 Tax=Pigmentiphaga soli TaxID=1007095 RepID=A0ABP8H8Q1_9BURK